ncbi:hypothetical protein SALWKB12_0743 [Snodgrassella communis]|nr:hypothetical protein SALWKB12_0743 [Snodgrassella communis]
MMILNALIGKFSQITRNDGNEKYAQAQFELGFIYKRLEWQHIFKQQNYGVPFVKFYRRPIK